MPAVCVWITADVGLDVPARFTVDHTAAAIETLRLYCWQQIPTVGLKGRRREGARRASGPHDLALVVR